MNETPWVIVPPLPPVPPPAPAPETAPSAPPEPVTIPQLWVLQDATGKAVRVVQTRSPGRHPRFDGIDCEGLTARQVGRALRDHECWCPVTKLWVGDDAKLARIEDAARLDCMTPFEREEERHAREADMLATIAALTARVAALEPDAPPSFPVAGFAGAQL